MVTFNGKRILVTGAANGVGWYLAEQLAARGATLIMLDQAEQQLADRLDALQQAGHAASAFTCRYTSQDEVGAVASQIQSVCGDIDVLIHAAACCQSTGLMDEAGSDPDSITINYLFPRWLTHAFARQMASRGAGHVVTLASPTGWFGFAGYSGCCAGQAARIAFAEALGPELQILHSELRSTLVVTHLVVEPTGLEADAAWQGACHKILLAVAKKRERLVLPAHLQLVHPLRLLPSRWLRLLLKRCGPLFRLVPAAQGRRRRLKPADAKG